MSSIFVNGVQYGDSTKWMDLLSKPTINTHLVEDINTSSDLDIFKYITLEDFKDLLNDPLNQGDHLNPYCVYVVDDDTNNIQRIYFSNGSQLYVYNDYTVVDELIEDSTLLQYLKEDTLLHEKGVWGYIETTPGTFEFVRIINEFDGKSLKNNGESIFAQKGGYISGTGIVLDSIINNSNPNSIIVGTDTKTLVFDSMPYNYTPNTKYELSITYAGATSSTVYTPTTLKGNDVLDFSNELKITLNSTEYPSSILSDYTVTLTWYKPTDISYINPLYIKIGEDFEIKDGLLNAIGLWQFDKFIPISPSLIDDTQNEKLQKMIDSILIEEEHAARVIYGNSEKMFVSKELRTDGVGTYFSWATTLDHDIKYRQVRVYLDPNTKIVSGAREVQVKLTTLGTTAPTTLLHNTIFATPVAP